ncbi:MAG: ATP-binding protein [Bacteroidales bacterium]|nr:MAG: ATP-binding protein [Bacteroidales bacterium]
MKKTITIDSKVENICAIEKIIDEVSDEIKVSSDIYGKILIATIEAVNNSIVHGNELDPNKKVFIEIFFEKPNLHILVADQGKGFDFSAVPDPTTPENIENVSGRGVFLMKKLADNLIFNDTGTQVELIFKI